MTLIELTVVLLILIGLAGLLLPYVGGFTEKTQNSSAADSLAEVNKAIHRFDAQYMAFPDGFDSLVDTSGGTVVDWLAGKGGLAPTELALCSTIAPATTGVAEAFIKAEIDTLYQLDSSVTDFNATFNNSTSAKFSITQANYNKLACLTTAAVQSLVQQKMGVEVDADDLTATPDNVYVVLGVGSKTQMNGKVLSEAPVYFTNGNDNPSSRYARFLAVFRVPTDGTRASYVGALTSDLKTAGDFLQAHYSSIEDND